jgi:hypothetical protein
MIKGMTAASSLFEDQASGLERIAAVFEKIGDKAAFTGRDLLALERTGVPVVKVLSEMTGLSEKVLRKSELNPEVAMRLLSQGWEMKYGKLAEQLGQGLSGRQNAFELQTARLAGTATMPLRYFLTKRLAQVDEALDSSFGMGLAQSISQKSAVVLTAIDGVLDAIIGEVEGKLGIKRGHAGGGSSVFSSIGEAAGADFIAGFQQGAQQGDIIEQLEKVLEDPRVRAFLATIRKAEGAGYNTLVGGGSFRDMSQIPQWAGWRSPKTGKISHAFGGYQFQPGTYREQAAITGLYDVSPQS